MEIFKVGDLVDINYNSQPKLGLVLELLKSEATVLIDGENGGRKLKYHSEMLCAPRASSSGLLGTSHSLLKTYFDDNLLARIGDEFITDVKFLGNGSSLLSEKLVYKFRVLLPINAENIQRKLKRNATAFEDQRLNILGVGFLLRNFCGNLVGTAKITSDDNCALLEFCLKISTEVVASVEVIFSSYVEFGSFDEEINDIFKEAMYEVFKLPINRENVKSELVKIARRILEMTSGDANSWLGLSLKYRVQDFSEDLEKLTVTDKFATFQDMSTNIKDTAEDVKNDVVGIVASELKVNEKYISDEFSVLNSVEYLVFSGRNEETIRLIKWRKEILTVGAKCGWLVGKLLFDITKEKLEVSDKDIIAANLQAMDKLEEDSLVSDSKVLFDAYEERLKNYLSKIK